MNEQTINIQDIKKLLPNHAQVTFQKKRGQTGSSLEVDVKIKPSISEKEHDKVVQDIINFLGEDLSEVYTETTGYHFLIYIHLSASMPTTVIP